MQRDASFIVVPTDVLTTVTGGAGSCDDAFTAWTAAKRTNAKDAEGVWAAYATPSLPAAVAKEGRSQAEASEAFRSLKQKGCFSYTGDAP